MKNGYIYSNVFLDISPIYEINDESDPWDLSINPDVDLSLSRVNSINNRNLFVSYISSEEKEILENKKKNLENNKIDKKEEELEKKEEEKEEKKEEEKEEENIEDSLGSDILNYLCKQNEPLPIPEKKKKEDDELSNKTTDVKTKNNMIGINKCIFGVKTGKKIEPRIDYAIKNFKVYLIKYLKDYGNQLIKDCHFKNKLKKIKLFSPSYKYFTGNSNEKDNKIYLDFTLEEIFTYPNKKLEKNDNRLQRQNKQIINSFKEYINENYSKEIPEKIQKIQNFLKMSFYDAIQLFYNSKQFYNYSSSQKTRFLDEQFIRSKGFSLLEKNAFIKLMKNYKRTG